MIKYCPTCKTEMKEPLSYDRSYAMSMYAINWRNNKCYNCGTNLIVVPDKPIEPNKDIDKKENSRMSIPENFKKSLYIVGAVAVITLLIILIMKNGNKVDRKDGNVEDHNNPITDIRKGFYYFNWDIREMNCQEVLEWCCNARNVRKDVQLVADGGTFYDHPVLSWALSFWGEQNKLSQVEMYFGFIGESQAIDFCRAIKSNYFKYLGDPIQKYNNPKYDIEWEIPLDTNKERGRIGFHLSEVKNDPYSGTQYPVIINLRAFIVRRSSNDSIATVINTKKSSYRYVNKDFFGNLEYGMKREEVMKVPEVFIMGRVDENYFNDGNICGMSVRKEILGDSVTISIGYYNNRVGSVEIYWDKCKLRKEYFHRTKGIYYQTEGNTDECNEASYRFVKLLTEMYGKPTNRLHKDKIMIFKEKLWSVGSTEITYGRSRTEMKYSIEKNNVFDSNDGSPSVYFCEKNDSSEAEKNKWDKIDDSQFEVGDKIPDDNRKINAQLSSTSEMIYVEGGAFQMGSNDGDDDEKPVHTVTVKNFYMDKHEVTVAQFRNYCESIGRLMPMIKPNYGWRDNDPITGVAWKDAVAYAKWTGKRLPTEAEWEYAARGGSQSKGYRYSGSDNYEDVGWNGDNSNGRPHTVCTKQPNELGIYDMSGNADEWCSDWYDENYYQRSPSYNPTGPVSGQSKGGLDAKKPEHVSRGGHCTSGVNAYICRVSARRGGSGYLTGFRCVKDYQYY